MIIFVIVGFDYLITTNNIIIVLDIATALETM